MAFHASLCGLARASEIATVLSDTHGDTVAVDALLTRSTCDTSATALAVLELKTLSGPTLLGCWAYESGLATIARRLSGDASPTNANGTFFTYEAV